MNKFISLVVGSILLVGAVGCENNAKTSATAPNNPNQANQENQAAVSPDAQSAQQSQGDAVSDTRKAQIESDIRAREQRSDVTGGDTDRADGDLESEVRGKLEANLPASQLTVDSKEGVVTVAGTVPTPEQRSKIDSLAMEIKGVKSVNNKVAVAPATSQ